MKNNILDAYINLTDKKKSNDEILSEFLEIKDDIDKLNKSLPSKYKNKLKFSIDYKKDTKIDIIKVNEAKKLKMKMQLFETLDKLAELKIKKLKE